MHLVARMRLLDLVPLVLAAAILHQIQCDELTLKLAQVIYRHGDRSPQITFPTDQWKDYWSGLGQLTKLGMQQQFELGQYFRKRYGHLLNTTYKREEIYVRSTDFDRTLMSAYCNLAGLYRPVEDQVWNNEIPWIPIPVHTVPADEDNLMYSRNNCPKYVRLVKNRDANDVQEMTDEEKIKQEELVAFATRNAGIEISVSDINPLEDLFNIQKIHNLSLPDWAETYLNKLQEYNELKEERSSKDNNDSSEAETEINKFQGGPLLGNFIVNMKKKIDGNITEKLFMYSGHDINLVHLFAVLQVSNDVWPEYRASLMFELYEDNMKRHFVQISYRNATDHEPYEISIPDCPSLCPFEQFQAATSKMAVFNFLQECQD